MPYVFIFIFRGLLLSIIMKLICFPHSLVTSLPLFIIFMHNKYFESYPKYTALLQSHQKIELMIEKGSLQVASQTPLPIINRNSSVRNKPTNSTLVKSIRKKASPSHKEMQQISSKNKRMVQSLLAKYHILSSSIQKAQHGQGQEKVCDTIGKKVCEYQQVLRCASHRLPTSNEEEEYLADSPYNLKLAYSLEKDLQELKHYAHQFNCSLHRKDKYYDCIDDIRRKINSMGQREEKKPLFTEPTQILGRNKLKEIAVPRQINLQRVKGKEYLSFSREVGAQSKERNFNERGKIRFVREVVHNWWSNSNRVSALQSSLS